MIEHPDYTHIRKAFQQIADALARVVDLEKLRQGLTGLFVIWRDQELRISALERRVAELERGKRDG